MHKCFRGWGEDLRSCLYIVVVIIGKRCHWV
jgi:hypothetical protein